MDYSRILRAEVKEYDRINSGTLTPQEARFNKGLLDAVDRTTEVLERMRKNKTLKTSDVKQQLEMIKDLTTPIQS